MIRETLTQLSAFLSDDGRVLRARNSVLWVVATAAIAGGVLIVLIARSVAIDLQTPRDHSDTRYVGSDSCRSCHPQHHASWRQTFHRTMTQAASIDSVLGDFNNAGLDYGGVHARMTRDEQQRYTIEFSSDGGSERWQATVERTVGSHRLQQYLARDGDVWFRLPVAWDVERASWIHMNGAFLTPDPTAPTPNTAIDRSDYDRHVTRWNDNCVFCHNVAPNPGLESDGAFQTTTAELGVACEACHGPGDEHVRVNRNPLRRYALHLSRVIDPSIANPARMTAERSSEVCGRCHGQRKATDISRVLREGDRFIPGTPLSVHSTPLARDTTLNGEHDVFAARFWNDGTPRLTAYEYQGVLQSPCAIRGELSCASCHAMHESDPNQQLRRDLPNQDNALCTQCHVELSNAKHASAHSHHGASSSGNECRACHMPNVAYGLIGARVSHRIETPNPAQNATDQRPDACTLCHVGQSREWAVHALGRFRREQRPVITIEAATRPEVGSRAFGGDPIERALATAALGRKQDLDPNQAERVALLLDVLAHDRYPAIRQLARRSLLAVIPNHEQRTRRMLSAFDVTELSTDIRTAAAEDISSRLGGPQLRWFSESEIAMLRARASERDIEIGE